MRRGPQPKPDNTPVASQATRAKSYSFDEDIQPPPRAQATPSERDVRQGGARHAHSKAAATHSADHLRHEGAVRQRMVSALWPAASLRAGQHGRFHQHRHADHRSCHRGRLERRTADHPGGHGGSWRRPEVCRPRTHRLRPPMVPGLSGRQGTSHLRHRARLRTRSEEAQFLGGIGRLRRIARLCREVRQIRRSQGDPRRDDFRRSGRVSWKRPRSFRRLAAQRRSTMAGSTAPFPPGCRPEAKCTPSVFWSGSTRTRSTSAFPRAPRFTSTSRRRWIWAKPLSAFPLAPPPTNPKQP